MKFTGERYIPSEKGEIRVEHLHRYAMAMDFASNKDVLDLACGEGYGCGLLAGYAKSVVGIDAAVDAVNHARQEYASLSNLSFYAASAENTGLPDQSFDLIVSFETIEHLLQQEEMILEMRRLLRPDGVLIISSPNRVVYSEKRNYKNEFHLKELDYGEFVALLQPHFDWTELYGQRLAMGTVIQPLDGSYSEYKAYSDDGINLHQNTSRLDSPVYFIAVCGFGNNNKTDKKASICMPDGLDLVEQYVGYAKWAANQEDEIALRDKNVYHYKNLADKLKLALDQSQIDLQLKNEELMDIQHRLSLTKAEISRADAQLALLKDLWLANTTGESLKL